MNVPTPNTAGMALRRCLLVISLALFLTACQVSSTPAETPQNPMIAQSAVPSPSYAELSSAPAPGTFTSTPVVNRLPSPSPSASPTIVPTTGEGMVTAPAGRVVAPILMYHHISDKGGGRYTINVNTFRAQLQYLYDEGYQTVSISRLAEVIRQGGSLPEKTIVLTFDDGYLDVYENAFPIMEEFHFSGVVYIITSTLEKDKSYGYLQESELKELLASGWEIGSHSVTHTDLNKTKLGIGNEMKESKAVLEKQLGVPVESFSYPFGIANDSIKDLAEKNGYQTAVGIGSLMTHTTKQLFFLSRREVYRSLPMFGFHKLLAPGKEEQAYNDLLSTQTPTMP